MEECRRQSEFCLALLSVVNTHICKTSPSGAKNDKQVSLKEYFDILGNAPIRVPAESFERRSIPLMSLC